MSDYFDKRIDRVFGLQALATPPLQTMVADPFARRGTLMPQLVAADGPDDGTPPLAALAAAPPPARPKPAMDRGARAPVTDKAPLPQPGPHPTPPGRRGGRPGAMGLDDYLSRRGER